MDGSCEKFLQSRRSIKDINNSSPITNLELDIFPILRLVSFYMFSRIVDIVNFYKGIFFKKPFQLPEADSYLLIALYTENKISHSIICILI